MELTCIVCPVSCLLEIEAENGEIIDIKGMGCKRGEKYAKEEFTYPKRILTTTVKASNNEMIPVRSDKPLPKDRLFEVMDKINSITVDLPVNIGDIIIKNIFDDVNIVATKNLK